MRAVAAFAVVSLLVVGPVRAESSPGPGGPDAGISGDLPAELPTFTGDWDVIKRRGVLRALVVYSRTFYFVDRGSQRGLSYELLKAFEADINSKQDPHALRFNVVFIPVARDELIPALLDGRGDIAAASLTITPDRQKLVDFSVPLATNVSEVVVTGPGGPRITSVEELSGKKLHVRKSSSYWEHLEQLNCSRCSQ